MEQAVAYEEFEDRREIFQADARGALKTARENGINRGLLEIYTGGGKTKIAIDDIKDFIAENPDAKVLVLSHSTPLSEQLQREFEKSIGPERSYGLAFGGTLEDQEQFVFANFQTMNSSFGGSKLYEGFNQEEFDYILVDESHHAPAKTYREVIDYFKPQFLLGMTATPDRRDNKDLLEIFGQVLYRKSLEQALIEGLLNPAEYKLFTEQLNEEGLLALDHGKVTLKQLQARFTIPMLDEEILEIHAAEADNKKDPYGILYTGTIDHADRIAGRMGDRAVAIHTGLGKKRLEDNMRAFFEKQVPFAVAIGILDEGIDMPDLNIVTFIRETSSKIRLFQRIGRMLGRRTLHKEPSTFLDFTNSLEQINLLLELDDTLQAMRDQSPYTKGVLDLAFRFNFSTEQRSLVDVVRQVNTKTAVQSKQMEPFKRLKPVEPITLEIASDKSESGAETIELSALESFCLQQAFESPTGSFEQGFIQQAHKFLFGKAIKLKELSAIFKDLEKADILSVHRQKGADANSMKGNRWRITSKGMEALIQVEPYHTAYQQALATIHNQISRHRQAAIERGGSDADSVKLKTDSEPESTRLSIGRGGFILQQPTGRQELSSLDATRNELDQLFKTNHFSSYFNSDRYFVTTRHLIEEERVTIVRSIFERNAGANNVPLTRVLSAGEIHKLTEKLAAYEVR